MDSAWVNTSLGLNLFPFEQPPNKGPLTKPEFEEANIVSAKEAASQEHVLAEELNRMSFENKKLTEMLTSLCESYNTLHSQVRDLMTSKQKHQINGSDDQHHDQDSKKRKADTEDYNHIIINGVISPNGTNNYTETSSISDEESCKRPTNLKISRVCVRTEISDTRLIVKDGYQWRKYGQKVTRDNPSPRAYYKCSFAPSCPVKKKVQKSAENPCLLVATYEGEHNHMHPETRAEVTLIGTPISPNQRPILSPTSPTLSFDSNRIVSPNNVIITRPKEATDDDDDDDKSGPAFQQFLVQQMASSLTKDPNFTSALAAAISGRISDHSRIPKW